MYIYVNLSISIYLFLSLSISIFLSLSISIYLSIYLYLSLSLSISIYPIHPILSYPSLSYPIYLSILCVYTHVCVYIYIACSSTILMIWYHLCTNNNCPTILLVWAAWYNGIGFWPLSLWSHPNPPHQVESFICTLRWGGLFLNSPKASSEIYGCQDNCLKCTGILRMQNALSSEKV